MNNTINSLFNQQLEGVFYPRQSQPIVIDDDILDELCADALTTQKRRSRICLHSGSNEVTHVMIIALLNDSKILLHSHPSYDEYYSLLRGQLELTWYNQSCTKVGGTVLSAQHSKSSTTCLMPANIIHTVKSLTDVSVFLEIANGPFHPSNTTFHEPAKNVTK